MKLAPALAFAALLWFVTASTACLPRTGQKMVDAGGYRVLMLVEGKGTPAVVFIGGGFGGPLDSENKVRLKVRKFVRTVVYQRGGIGESEPAPPPRDSKHIASELHTALTNAGVPPPYILLGASLGGIHARVFANMYPADVAGLALIDPTPEDFEAELIKALGPETQKRVEAQKRVMARQVSQMPQGSRYEYEALETSFQQAREAWPLPRVPVVLFTSTQADGDMTMFSPVIWLELHKRFLNRVPGSRHVVTEKSGHDIDSEEPDLIVDALLELIRGKSPQSPN